MATEQARTTMLAQLEGLMKAELWQWECLDDILEVSVSPLVHPTDDCLFPVYDYLSNNCSREMDWATVEDDSMVFGGEAQVTTYAVHTVCPGHSIPHNCKFERAEVFATVEGE